MKFDRKMLTLYAVTDRAWLGGRTLEDDVKAALRGGVTLVQLREKELEREALIAEAERLVRVCHRHGVPLIINDDAEIARLVHADGVHLGQSDGSPELVRRTMGDEFIIGVSARTVSEARAAEAAGADYIGVGAMFPTATKTGTRHITPPELAEIAASVKIPAVAIGGINAHNIRTLAGTGIAGTALVSAIFSAGDSRAIEEGARRLYAISKEIFR